MIGQYFGNSGSVSFDPFNDVTHAILLDDQSIVESLSRVSQWTDQSGNANNFRQTTGADQPVYVASAINSLPGVYFDSGITSTSVSLAASAVSPSIGNQLTYFVVFARTVDKGIFQNIFSETGVGNSKRIFISGTGDDIVYEDGGSGTDGLVVSIGNGNTSPHVLAFTQNGTSINYWLDNTTKNIGFSVGASYTGITNFILGNNQGLIQPFDGTVSWFGLVNSVLSDAVIEQYVSYLKTRFNV